MWCMTQYSHRTFSPTSLHEFSHTPFHENHVCIVSSIREDVKGVAGVALATPFFPDLFYMPSRLLAIVHPTIWSSGLLVIWSSDHPVIQPSGHPTIRLSGHPDFWPSGHPTIWSSKHPVIRPSGLLSRCLKNVPIGIFLAYLLVGYTNLKFLMSSLLPSPLSSRMAR